MSMIKEFKEFAMSKTGSRSQALENYRKSVQTLEALSDSMPTHAGIREQLAEAHSRVAGFSDSKQISTRD